VALGLLWSLGRVLERALAGPPSPLAWAKTFVDCGWVFLAFGLAGWGMALLCRFLAAWVLDQSDRAARASEEWLTQTAQVVAVLERILTAVERRTDQAAEPTSSAVDRSRSSAQIEHALGSGQWAEAESLLGPFEAEFPEDPALPGWKEQLATHRRRETEAQMSQLEAARAVNDAARVFELYRSIGPSLASDERGVLERDLARWFLNLIHRRLRSGKIHEEVVTLATQVAETFSATVEGASMRAALPTLRRSVGLCPRCAQPYTGAADACPRCRSNPPGA
jgi:hypothetical protein